MLPKKVHSQYQTIALITMQQDASSAVRTYENKSSVIVYCVATRTAKKKGLQLTSTW
jgi:hypothetical protein